MSESVLLEFEAGAETESLAKFIAEGLSDEELDVVEIGRRYQKSEGLVAEPVTVAVVVTVAPLLTYAVVRLVEKWLEKERQREQLRILADADTKKQRAILELAKQHANVTVKWGKPEVPKA